VNPEFATTPKPPSTNLPVADEAVSDSDVLPPPTVAATVPVFAALDENELPANAIDASDPLERVMDAATVCVPEAGVFSHHTSVCAAPIVEIPELLDA
jgi:hypothetical protein